jgi:hypothetical protein
MLLTVNIIQDCIVWYLILYSLSEVNSKLSEERKIYIGSKTMVFSIV